LLQWTTCICEQYFCEIITWGEWGEAGITSHLNLPPSQPDHIQNQLCSWGLHFIHKYLCYLCPSWLPNRRFLREKKESTLRWAEKTLCVDPKWNPDCHKS
jgi:hypothetical protein